MMKQGRIVLILLMMCLSFSVYAQHRQVRVTTLKGSVFEGALLEFKGFEYLILETTGGNAIRIDYQDMAYIDEIKPGVAASAPATFAPAKVETPVEEPKSYLAEVPEPKQEAVVPEPQAAPAVTEPQLVVPEPAPVAVLIPEPKSEPEPQPVVPEPEPEAAAVPVVVPVPEPEAAAVPAVVSEPEAAAKVETVSKWGGYKGFLLDSGNSVSLDCVSTPTNDAYNDAALDVLRRQLKRDGFWKMVDSPDEAHFSIVCMVGLQGKSKVGISIKSKINGQEELLGEMNGPEDVAEYRKLVWELYNKHIIPLQKKIESGNIPKRTKKNFTAE